MPTTEHRARRPRSLRRKTLTRRVCGLAAAVTLIGAVTPLGAQRARPLDRDVKAVYLLNFGRFTTWPSNKPAASRESLAVCILGNDPFGPALDATVAGEVIDGKPVTIKRLAAPQEANGCSILFFSTSESQQLDRTLKLVGEMGTLTVSDMPQFVNRGGMIQFISEDNKVRFEVNLPAVEQAGLTLSSELLRVALRARRPGA